MKANILMMSAAAALAFAPANALAAPAGHGPDHSNGPATTGQPNQSCEDLEDGGNDVRPGNAERAPGSAFNPDGNAGTHYAGEQPQNSRNTASVSQYDTACLHQPL
jgi:hypothetical protein